MWGSVAGNLLALAIFGSLSRDIDCRTTLADLSLATPAETSHEVGDHNTHLEAKGTMECA